MTLCEKVNVSNNKISPIASYSDRAQTVFASPSQPISTTDQVQLSNKGENSQNLKLAGIGLLPVIIGVLTTLVWNFITGCSSDKGEVEQNVLESGIPLNPEETPEGSSEPGVTELPEDIWMPIEGSGSAFQESPEYKLESGKISGKNLQGLNLRVVIGTDSTLIAEMPPEGCFDGLINKNQSEPELGDVGCPEKGYENFIACPSDEGNRLRLYVAGYSIEAFDVKGVKIGTESKTLTTIEELYVNPENGQILGVVCNGEVKPLEILLPKDWYRDGNLNINLRFNLFIDARQADRNANYSTTLVAKVME